MDSLQDRFSAYQADGASIVSMNRPASAVVAEAPPSMVQSSDSFMTSAKQNRVRIGILIALCCLFVYYKRNVRASRGEEISSISTSRKIPEINDDPLFYTFE